MTMKWSLSTAVFDAIKITSSGAVEPGLRFKPADFDERCSDDTGDTYLGRV